jgi:hypothetical protein
MFKSCDAPTTADSLTARAVSVRGSNAILLSESDQIGNRSIQHVRNLIGSAGLEELRGFCQGVSERRGPTGYAEEKGMAARVFSVYSNTYKRQEIFSHCRSAPIMANWMEILGVISALVGLLIAIPAIYIAVKTLYRRIHHVGSCCEAGKRGQALTIEAGWQVRVDPRIIEEGDSLADNMDNVDSPQGEDLPSSRVPNPIQFNG